jgi:hypothetical protein
MQIVGCDIKPLRNKRGFLRNGSSDNEHQTRGWAVGANVRIQRWNTEVTWPDEARAEYRHVYALSFGRPNYSALSKDSTVSRAKKEMCKLAQLIMISAESSGRWAPVLHGACEGGQYATA